LKKPEVLANHVIDKLRIFTPEDLLLLEKIVLARGAVVVYEPLQGSEARLLSIPGNRPIITVSSNVTYLPRQRFSIAHELGHLEMHRNQLHSISCDADSITPLSFSKPDIEVEANQFASSFLLPKRFVGHIFEEQDPSFSVIQEVADRFAVSLSAAGSRYMNFLEEPAAFVISKRGRILRFVPTDSFLKADLFIRVNEGVEQDSMAEKLLRGVRVRPGWHDVPAEYWLTEKNFMRGARVKEWSFYSERFEMALSLIWVDEDVVDEWRD